jgi:hypothetical protein
MRTHARYRHTALVALSGLVLLATAGTSARPFPEFIPLPADFGPEGIAVGNGTTFYAGSLVAANLSGTVGRFITEPFTSNPGTKVPTTIAEFGKALYAVTAGFAAPTPDFVVRVEK